MYDLIFVGTSPISVLEAVYQSRGGKSVLMIDQQPDMGGAWMSLEIFGLHDVENAIHYFLPDSHAFDFMRDTLGWNVIPSPRKYQVFPTRGLGYWRMPYDNAFARFVGKISAGALNGPKREIAGKLARAVRDVWTRSPSRYVAGGVPEMLRSVKQLLVESTVQTAYSTTIDGIEIDRPNERLTVETGDRRITARTIVFTHGSRIFNLRTPEGPVEVIEKLHPRPAVHLLVNDTTPSSIYECVFTADPLIKYVHDVTRFTREAGELIGRRKVLVLALHNHVEPSEEVYGQIFAEIKRAGMVGRQAVMERHNWWSAFLPTLEDSDLYHLKDMFGDQVDILRTENFARGIGYHVKRWSERIPPFAVRPNPTDASASSPRGRELFGPNRGKQ